MSVAQLAVYFSLKLALRVIKEKKPERLYETLTEENGGEREIRTITDRGLKKMKATTRKAWSVRVLRWFKLIPWDIKEGDIKKKATKEKLKRWIKHVIPVRGDRVLWGQQLTGDRRRQVNREASRPWRRWCRAAWLPGTGGTYCKSKDCRRDSRARWGSRIGWSPRITESNCKRVSTKMSSLLKD